ncbi:MAG: hypothetical protein U5K38_19850 [Woeseiaceae bacterium]|nr:hypothetical protein [Woeseiaceae bacterium]
MSPEAGFLGLLRHAVRQPAGFRTHSSRSRTAPAAAWKTGTSYAYRDAWTVGVTAAITCWPSGVGPPVPDGSGSPHLVGRKAGGGRSFFIDCSYALPDAGTARG